MFTALLDTCVLWPSLQRDFLLSLAVEGMYRPVWSSAILGELEYGEAEKLTGRGANAVDAARRARRLVVTMRARFSDAEVEGWEGLDGTFGLPDHDDEHVLAAAVLAGAGAIVTTNVKDFPSECLRPGLEVLLPAQFALYTVELDPIRSLGAVEKIVARSGRHGERLSAALVLDKLERHYSMHEAVDLLRDVLRSA